MNQHTVQTLGVRIQTYRTVTTFYDYETAMQGKPVEIGRVKKHVLACNEDDARQRGLDAIIDSMWSDDTLAGFVGHMCRTDVVGIVE